MSDENTYLEGIPISYILSCDNYEYTILSSDLFLISQKYLRSVDPNRTYSSNGVTYEDGFQSKNYSYNQLSAQLLNDMADALGLRTMSSQNSSDYSLADHLHNYSIISAHSYYDSGDLSNFAFQFIIDSDPYRFYSPIDQLVISYKSNAVPQIGQLKFLAVNSLQNIDVDASDFTGWVYPDGRQVSKTKFSKAYAAFGDTYNTGNETEGYFRIPTFNSFLKVIPDISTSTQLYGTKPEIKYLKEHSHDINDIQLSGNASTQLSMLGVDNTQAGGATHSPTTKTNPNRTYTVNLSFKATGLNFVDSNNQTLCSNVDLDIPTYPSHNLVPVLIYIGVQ